MKGKTFPISLVEQAKLLADQTEVKKEDGEEDFLNNNDGLHTHLMLHIKTFSTDLNPNNNLTALV